MNTGAQLVSSLSLPFPFLFLGHSPSLLLPHAIYLSLSSVHLSISPCLYEPGLLLYVPDFVILGLPGPHSLTLTLLHFSLPQRPHLGVVPLP